MWTLWFILFINGQWHNFALNNYLSSAECLTALEIVQQGMYTAYPDEIATMKFTCTPIKQSL